MKKTNAVHHKIFILSSLFCLLLLNPLMSQEETDTSKTEKPTHRFIFGSGFGLGLSTVWGESNSTFSPSNNLDLVFGYRLGTSGYLSTGMFFNSERIDFTRSGDQMEFTGSTVIIPLSIGAASDKPGITPVSEFGVFFRTDQLGDSELYSFSDNTTETGSMVFNFGSHLKIGLAYNDYSDFLFLNGVKFEVTYNNYSDLIGDELKLTTSAVMFRVTALF